MRSSRQSSLLSAGLFAIVASTLLAVGCRPTSDQGSSGGAGKSGEGEGGSGGGGSGGTGSGGQETGGERDGDGGSGGTGTGGSETGGSGGSGSGGQSSGTGGNGGGGATSAGGSTAGGGSTGSTPSGNTVTIVEGKGSGAMVGYGWVALGAKDNVKDPTCGGTTITSASSCASTTWSTKDSLCVSGDIPALPEKPADTDYTDNWGISVGLNASETAGKGIGQSFATIAMSVKGSPSTGLRAVVHKGGDPDATGYCLAYTGSTLDLAKFSQDCYGAGTKLLAASDIPNIDKVSIQVVSTSAGPITVDNLCLTGITFGN
jgi:hypothetical protein